MSHSSPDTWIMPMHIGKNANGLPRGDDANWRKVEPLSENPDAPLVQPDVLVRPVYAGVSPYNGERDPALALGGMLEGNAIVVRESLARLLENI